MLAVDIGAESVRVAEFTCDRKGRWHLRDWLQMPRRDGANAALPKGRFGGRWRRGFDISRQRPAVTCVSACDVTVRALTVPSTFSHGQIREVLENDNPFPQPLSDLCVDYREAVSQDPDEMRLLLAATPRRLVDERIRQVTAMGLKPTAVVVDAFALQQLTKLTECPAECDTSQLFILIDQAQFALYVMQAGKLVYTRRHPLSSPEVAAAAREMARAVQLFAVSSVMGGVARLILAGSHTDIEVLGELLASISGLTAQVLDVGAVITHSPTSSDTADADQGADHGTNLHPFTLAFALVMAL